jgi:hypothetical protein
MKKKLQVIFLILLFPGCASDEKIDGFTINEEEVINCNEEWEDSNLFYYQDTIEKFKIKLPRDWWLEQSLIDGKYGITTVDISLTQGHL